MIYDVQFNQTADIVLRQKVRFYDNELDGGSLKKL